MTESIVIESMFDRLIHGESAAYRDNSVQHPRPDQTIVFARVEERESITEVFDQAAHKEETANLRKKISDINSYAISGSDGDFISVGIAECAEMGNIASSIYTPALISRYHPSLAIFSGIAGSLDATKLRVGDVITPRTIYTRYFYKLKEFRDGETSATWPECIEKVNGKLVTKSKSIDIGEKARRMLGVIDLSEMSDKLNNIPIESGVINIRGAKTARASASNEEESFCWDKVLSNKKYVDILRERISNACTAVEMESYGFLRAVNMMKESMGEVTEGMIVRSISDYAENKEATDQDNKWRNLALSNMSIATLYIISNAYIEVFGRST